MLEPKCSSIASKPSVQDTYPLHSSIILFLPPPHPPLTRSSRHTSLYNLSIHSLEALTFNPKQSQTDQLSLSHPMLLFCSVLFCSVLFCSVCIRALKQEAHWHKHSWVLDAPATPQLHWAPETETFHPSPRPPNISPNTTLTQSSPNPSNHS